MHIYLICGQTGSGKTFYIENELLPEIILKKYDIFIFDVNNEYQIKNKYSFVGMDDFLEKVENIKNSCIVFEEATAFFNNRGAAGQTLINLIVRKRHQNNILVFVFHSLRQIPVYVFDFCNYLILFRTNDREDIVRNKFKFNDDIIRAYSFVKNMCKQRKYFKTIKKLY